MINYSIIIPAYNEETILKTTLSAVTAFFSHLKASFEIFIVDDGSLDRTKTIAQSLVKKNHYLKLLSHSPNRGKGYSLRQGILAAKGQIILFTDCDLSTPITTFRKFLPYFKQGAAVVIGTRHHQESKILVSQPVLRLFFNQIYHRLVSFLVPLKNITDTTCGFKAFTKPAAKEIFSRQKIPGWGFDPEILFLAQTLGYKIVEVPVSWSNRRASRVRLISTPFIVLGELLLIRFNHWRGKYTLSV